MPITNKEEAIAFMSAYRAWLMANTATGNGAFIAKNSKPATVRAPDLCAKAAEAEVMAEQCYWQMPYEQAKRKHYDLPFSRWQSERVKRNMLALA